MLNQRSVCGDVMTREQRKQQGRRFRAVICLIILAAWVAALLTVCAEAAYETTEAAAEPNRLTLVLAGIGDIWVSWQLMRFIQWLDTPKRRDRK